MIQNVINFPQPQAVLQFLTHSVFRRASKNHLLNIVFDPQTQFLFDIVMLSRSHKLPCIPAEKCENVYSALDLGMAISAMLLENIYVGVTAKHT